MTNSNSGKGATPSKSFSHSPSREKTRPSKLSSPPNRSRSKVKSKTTSNSSLRSDSYPGENTFSTVSSSSATKSPASQAAFGSELSDRLSKASSHRSLGTKPKPICPCKLGRTSLDDDWKRLAAHQYSIQKERRKRAASREATMAHQTTFSKTRIAKLQSPVPRLSCRRNDSLQTRERGKRAENTSWRTARKDCIAFEGQAVMWRSGQISGAKKARMLLEVDF